MKLYRYRDHRAGSLEGDDSHATAWCYEFEVIKETPKGYWIEGKCWISKTSKKRYAHPTKEEAWKSFKARKARQIKILKTRLAYAEEAARLTQPDD